MPCWERLLNGDFDVEVNYFSTFSFLFGEFGHRVAWIWDLLRWLYIWWCDFEPELGATWVRCWAWTRCWPSRWGDPPCLNSIVRCSSSGSKDKESSSIYYSILFFTGVFDNLLVYILFGSNYRAISSLCWNSVCSRENMSPANDSLSSSAPYLPS